MSSIGSSMYLGASAMNAFGTGMAVTAHNTANVNTAGFTPQRVTYADGPNGQGVRVEAVFQGSAPARPGTNPADRTYGSGGLPAEAINGLAAPATASPQELLNAGASASAVYGATSGMPPEFINPSGTDLGREMVQMLTVQRAYEANAQTVRTGDAMSGILLDMKA